MEKTIAKQEFVSTEYVNVTKQVKAMASKATPKIHHYRVDAIACVEIQFELFEDKYTEQVKLTLNEGYSIDMDKVKDSVAHTMNQFEEQVVILNSMTALIKALPSIQAPEEVVAKYAKPKKCKVTVDELLNNEKISESLKGMLAKEMGL